MLFKALLHQHNAAVHIGPLGTADFNDPVLNGKGWDLSAPFVVFDYTVHCTPYILHRALSKYHHSLWLLRPGWNDIYTRGEEDFFSGS